MLPAGLEPATGILLHPWHLERNKGCKGCVRDRKRRDACDCTPAILYCQKPPEGGGLRGRPGADGINLAQPKAAAQYAGAWSLFRTTLKTCSPVLAGRLFIRHDRRGNLASEQKFTQRSCSWHQSWCCEHAGKLQGPSELADVNGNLSVDFNRLWSRPLVCNYGHTWFLSLLLLTRDGKSVYKTSLQQLWLSNHLFPLRRGVCDQRNTTQTLLDLGHLLHCNSVPAHSAWRMPLAMAAGTAELCAVQSCPLLSPSSARVCFSTWCCDLTVKFKPKQTLKVHFRY